MSSSPESYKYRTPVSNESNDSSSDEMSQSATDESNIPASGRSKIPSSDAQSEEMARLEREWEIFANMLDPSSLIDECNKGPFNGGPEKAPNVKSSASDNYLEHTGVNDCQSKGQNNCIGEQIGTGLSCANAPIPSSLEASHWAGKKERSGVATEGNQFTLKSELLRTAKGSGKSQTAFHSREDDGEKLKGNSSATKAKNTADFPHRAATAGRDKPSNRPVEQHYDDSHPSSVDDLSRRQLVRSGYERPWYNKRPHGEMSGSSSVHRSRGEDRNGHTWSNTSRQAECRFICRQRRSGDEQFGRRWRRSPRGGQYRPNGRRQSRDRRSTLHAGSKRSRSQSVERCDKKKDEMMQKLAQLAGDGQVDLTKIPIQDIMNTIVIPHELRSNKQHALRYQMSQLTEAIRELTGVKIPSFYCTGAVNPLHYAEQMRKRKLLWSNKASESTSTAKIGLAITESQDQKTAEKFRKLLGIHGDACMATDQKESNAIIKWQKETFQAFDREYEMARLTTHSHRGTGLGFVSAVPSAATLPRTGERPTTPDSAKQPCPPKQQTPRHRQE